MALIRRTVIGIDKLVWRAWLNNGYWSAHLVLLF
jgi:hypothetical protein